MASRYTTKDGRTTKRGAFLNGVWHCDCDPRLPADKLQTKNGGKNHGRWFYTCRKPQVKRCNFFLWSDETRFREESAVTVLDDARSETLPQPQTPRKEATLAKMPPTPETMARDRFPSSARDGPMARETVIDKDSYGWASSGDEDLAQVADSAWKPIPHPIFETPRKGARTEAWPSPGKRSYNDMAKDSSGNPLRVNARASDDVFTTPHTSSRSLGLLSPLNTRALGRSQADDHVPFAEPSSLANDVLKVLEHVHIPSNVETKLIELLDRHDLRTQGIIKGRDIARIAIQTKEEKIAELQLRIVGLEGERETSKAVIAHLKQDIATSPKKGGASRGEPSRGARSISEA